MQNSSTTEPLEIAATSEKDRPIVVKALGIYPAERRCGGADRRGLYIYI